MRKLLATMSAALFAAAALAGPGQYNVRGAFNGWGESLMNDDLDGTFSLTVGGLGAGSSYEFKIAEDLDPPNDWNNNWPGSNAKTVADALGNITFHFRPGPVADGWTPGANRVGYDDHGQFGWEIQGAFNGWNDVIDNAARQMTDMGGGLYSVDYTIASPGSYDFKFRRSGSWDISIGDDFGNAAANANVVTTVVNEIVRFELDLPNGRWRTTTVPEPASIALIAAGAALATRFVRRRR